MPTPDFVLALRDKIGTQLLPMTGATAAVWHEDRILLGRRADTGEWALPSGIVEPGEEPAVGVAREVLEETGITCRVEALVALAATRVITYDNGDRSIFTDHLFTASWVAGEPHVADEESTEVGWFDTDALPAPLADNTRAHLDRVRAFTGRTQFVADDPAPVPVPDDQLDVAGREVVVRDAREADLPVLVAMLADDQLGATREDPTDLGPYAAALAAIDVDPAQRIVVAVEDEQVVGMLQISVLPGLSRSGATRGQLEGVRVAAGARGSGLGAALVGWAVQECRRRGCAMVQLTSDATRVDARRFYERLGFVASHTGFKIAV